MDTASDLPIPSNAGDITPSWVSAVTGFSVVPEGFNVEGEIQAGIGFQSSMCRVSFKTSTGENKNIILKLLPTDPKWLEYALTNESDEKEIYFYSKAFPDIVKVVPELQDNICEYYHASVRPADPSKGTPKSSILIMEDLKALGYDMMPYSGDSVTINQIMTGLARLHLGSLAVEAEKGTPLPTLYPFIQETETSFFAQMKKVLGDSFKPLKELLQSENISPATIESFEKLQPYAAIMAEKVDAITKKNACLIHGDIWPPNVLIHPTLPAKLIDWQLVGYRHPSIDLVMTMYMTLPVKDLNLKTMKGLVQKYREECEKLYKEKGLEGKIQLWDWQEFEEFCFTWGIGYGFMLIVGCLECLSDNAKYANLFRVMSEENGLPQFIINECKKNP